MGMFDSVWVPCPKCGKKSEFQSKSGDCTLASYEIDNAPASVLADVNRHAPNECECGAVFAVKVQCVAIPVLVNRATDQNQ